MTGQPPSEAEVRTALERVVSSSGFAGAGRLPGFLRYLVERVLSGESASIKESVLGVEVFERPADYDPRTDPIVRVEARRLRARLEEYYKGTGASDPIRIALPKGGYVPVFECPAAPEPESRPAILRGWRLVYGIGALAAIGIFLGYFQSRYMNRVTQAPVATVAVLPFMNVGANPENEYFSQGLTEEITDRLARIPGMKTVARSVVSQYRAAGDPRQVAEKVGASVLVEGSVRRQGDRIRVTARLIGASDGASLWSQVYERQARDIFAIQDEIAQSVAAALRVQVRAAPSQATPNRYTENIDAYNALLKARFQMNLFSREGTVRAIDYYSEAIRLQPDYAPAHAGRSLAHAVLGYYRAKPAAETWVKARTDAEEAIRLDPALADAHASRGFTLGFHEWRWRDAETSFRKALEIDPASAAAHGLYAAAVLLPEGRFEEAHNEFKKSLDLDPLSSFSNFTASYCLLAQGRYEDAVRQYKRTIELRIVHPDLYWDYAMALSFAGRREEAIEAFGKSRMLEGLAPAALHGLPALLTGDEATARRDVPEVERDVHEGREDRMDLVRLLAMLGEKSQALDWLEKAIDAREEQAFWAKVDPRLANLRGEPRYNACLAKLGLSERR